MSSIITACLCYASLQCADQNAVNNLAQKQLYFSQLLEKLVVLKFSLVVE